jgi:SH3-like domain-containing protein
MRRIVRGILALLLCAAPSLSAQAARVDSTRATTKTIATLRATASSKSKALATIPLGAVVRIGKCRGGWCAAQYGKVHGQVSQSALRIGIAIVTLPRTNP